jgi:DNA end-binding protein Ku
VPRSLWSGSLSFGLVNVPVRLASAGRDLDLHFRQLHGKDGAPIEQRRCCSEEGVEVPWEEIAKAYEMDDGEKVILTSEDLATVQPRKTRTIDVEAFVDLDQIDPIYFGHPWFLVPSGESEGTLRAYRLLVEVMESTGRVAIGRFVMRTKEYLVSVHPRDGLLALTTLLFHDEVRHRDEIAPGGRKPAKAKLEQAVAVIEELSTEWEPERYTDCYRERLLRVVDQKRQGERITVPEEQKEPKAAPDLMAALEETLAKIKGGTGEKAAAGNGAGEGNGAGKAGKAGSELEKMSREELYERAQREKVPGRSKMSKDELVEALS